MYFDFYYLLGLLFLSTRWLMLPGGNRTKSPKFLEMASWVGSILKTYTDPAQYLKNGGSGSRLSNTPVIRTHRMHKHLHIPVCILSTFGFEFHAPPRQMI